MFKREFRVWTMRVYWILSCLSVLESSSGQDLPRSCQMRDSILSCSLRTIGGIKVLLESVPPSVMAHLPALHLLCSDVLFFESSLAHPDHRNESSGFLFQLRSLTDLQIDYCKIRRVPPGVFARLGELRRLALRTHNNDWSAMMMDLNSESFAGLAELRQLDLSDNNIWNLPPAVFCPLGNLKSLNLTRNRISDVTQLGFSDREKVSTSCYAALEELNLSQNDMMTIEDGGLSGLRSLTSLQFQENALSSVGDGALMGLSALQLLNFSGNFLASLPPELFRATRDIKQIYLNNNSLSILAPGLLEGLDQLQVLDLSHNELTGDCVNKETFSGLVRMIVLNLAHNFITKLDSAMFKNLYSLQMLSLENNQIESIADDSFSELKNLHALTLSHNNIKKLDACHFSKLYVLNQLFLDHNSIYFIHKRAFENVTNLQDLGISANELNSIPEAIQNLRSLKSLDLGKNNITFLSNSSFEGLEKLYGLRLVDNRISKVFVESFKNLPSLQVLNLASNKISFIAKGSFDSNPSLKAVRVDGNDLREISGIFDRLASLVWLNVSENQIGRFRYDDLPSSLEWFNINSNHLKNLPSCAESRQNRIKILDASFNMIEEINGHMLPNTIELLYLNNNNIKSVETATFIQKKSLVKVVLCGNALRTMDIGALALSPAEEGRDVPEFYISGNPFRCDCSMEWLQRINRLAHTRRHPRVGDLEAVTCSLARAPAHAARHVLEIEASQFLCRYDAHCFALCHCCDFDACDCEMTCPKNCSCYHDLTWTANVVDCSNAGYASVPAKIPMDATEIHLDGNNFQDLGSHVFIGKKKLRVLFLNNSNLRNVHNRTFVGVESLKILHLENNKLEELRGDEFDQLHNLNELYLDHNGISRVGNDTFKSMKKLQVLRLDENKIVNFSPWQLLATSSGSLARVSLEGNEWSCDCRNVARLDSWLRRNPGDPEKMFCYENDRERETVAAVLSRCSVLADGSFATSVGRRDIYREPTFAGQNYVSIFAAIFILVILVCTVGALCFAFRQDVRLWAHSRYGVRLFKNSTVTNIAELDTDRLYDAYLVYSIEDEDFVTRAISRELEQSGYSVCMHYRDIRTLAGNSHLADSIWSTTEASKRIVIILTLNFLTLEWVNDDLRSSLLSTLKSLRSASRSGKMIFVLTTDVSALRLDADLQIFLRSHGVFYWGERRFWEKFRFAMPDIVDGKAKRVNSSQSLKCSNRRYATSPSLTEICHRYRETLPPRSSGSAGLQGLQTDGAQGSGSGTGGRTYFV